MPKIRGNVGAKWARRAGSAGQEYAEGIANPRRSWSQSTISAAPAHQAALTASFGRQAFQKGVAAAGDSRWSDKSKTKGVPRFAQGVSEGQADYEKGFAPYAQVIESINLPPRGPKGDPSNIQRVAAIAKAMRDKKLSIA